MQGENSAAAAAGAADPAKKLLLSVAAGIIMADINKKILRGRVKFPTGGKVRDPERQVPDMRMGPAASADPVKLRDQQ